MGVAFIVNLSFFFNLFSCCISYWHLCLMLDLYYSVVIDFIENRVEFLEKMQRVCGHVMLVGGVVLPILSSPSPVKLVVGNWSLICQSEGEITINNSDGTRVSIVSSGKGSSFNKVKFEVKVKLSYSVHV